MAISAASDLNGALAATLESLCAATGWSFGEAWMPETDLMIERTTHYAVPGAQAQPMIAAGASLKFLKGRGLPGLAWASKSIEWFPELGKVSMDVSPRVSAAAQCGFQAAVAVPVLSAQQVVAILVFFMDRPRATDDAHTQMVFVVANQVGAVIERRKEQKLYEAEIMRARDDALAASRAKSDFLSRMSHELRTPLNSVIGFANVLRKNKHGRLAGDELTFLDRIISNGKHLLNLVNHVLDIAKVEAGRLTVTTSMVNIDQLLHDIVSQLEGQPREAGVELRAEAPEEMVPIETDLVLMKQVLINLTGNALRFTKRGSVVLSAEVDSESGEPVRIHVRDTGIGIPPERQAAIFEPFEQAAEDTHRTYGGTGLGLSISKAICDALGYRLSLVSAPGQGATFTVHLQSSAAGSNQRLTPSVGSPTQRV
jgi:signal transduction histidine kinase